MNVTSDLFQATDLATDSERRRPSSNRRKVLAACVGKVLTVTVSARSTHDPQVHTGACTRYSLNCEFKVDRGTGNCHDNCPCWHTLAVTRHALQLAVITSAQVVPAIIHPCIII